MYFPSISVRVLQSSLCVFESFEAGMTNAAACASGSGLENAEKSTSESNFFFLPPVETALPVLKGRERN